MAKALDISNYTGRLNTQQIEWLQGRYDLVIVRLSTENNRQQRSIAAQQVAALAAARIPWQGYLWMYWEQYPSALWNLARERLPDGWPGYSGKGIWIDLEDEPGDSGLAATCLQAYLDVLETDGFTPGIYTGSWWVAKNEWLSDEPVARKLSTLPVWWADYNREPGAEIPLAGPFTDLAMHQYASHEFLGPMMACDESHIWRIV